MGITTIVGDKDEGLDSSKIRLAAYQLQKACKEKLGLSVSLDLREKLKLNQRLKDLME